VSFLSQEISGSIVQDLVTLKIQNNASKSLNEETDATLTAVTKDLEIKVSTVNALEEQFEFQRQEIEELNKERQTIIQLLQKTHGSLSFSEVKLDLLKK
jgi:hypothetical protein